MNRKKFKEKLKSLNDKSVLVRFNLFYFMFSLIPVALLVYLYYQYDPISHIIRIPDWQFSILILLVSFGSLVAFFGVRNALKKIMTLSSRLKEYFFGEIDKDTVLELARDEGEVAELARAFGDILGRLENSLKELKATKRTIYDILSKMGEALSSSESFESLLNLTLETLRETLGALRGAIYLFNEEKKYLEPSVLVGVINKESIPEKIKLGEGVLGLVVKEKKPILLPLVNEEEQKEDFFSSPLISVPLISRDLVGVIVLSGKVEKGNFSEDDLKLLSNLASQIAIAINNAKLNRDIEKTYFETMTALALAVEAKDPYCRGHSDRVADIAVKIAQEMNLDKDDFAILRDACKLHDIGKIGIEDNILQKPGELTPAEQRIMHKHPFVGADILRPLKTFKHLVEPILQHHERLDGSGYPNGLKGDQISLIARILCVADMFDALTTHRPYRKALNYEEAMKELEELAQVGKIDKEVVSILREVTR